LTAGPGAITLVARTGLERGTGTGEDLAGLKAAALSPEASLLKIDVTDSNDPAHAIERPG
jgi:hypothetical protein